MSCGPGPSLSPRVLVAGAGPRLDAGLDELVAVASTSRRYCRALPCPALPCAAPPSPALPRPIPPLLARSQAASLVQILLCQMSRPAPPRPAPPRLFLCVSTRKAQGARRKGPPAEWSGQVEFTHAARGLRTARLSVLSRSQAVTHRL